jgi:hypothetical protein
MRDGSCTVADLVADPRHAGALGDAPRVGEAATDGRVVRIGLWTRGAVVARARFMASGCAALIAYAEAACRLAEAGGMTSGGDHAAALRRCVAGVHPLHLGRADLVAVALDRALAPGGDPA